MTLLFLALSFWIGYLGAEALRLCRWRESIPLRITVTGTRGKTTVARLLAAVLRESGKTVMARTTGSEARVILPDGTEVPVRRRGMPSILEQIRFLRLAAGGGAQAVVAEIMSVHLENHEIESGRILRPHLVLMTNFRVDHPEAAGWTREEVIRLHLADVASGARVLIPEEEVVPGLSQAVAARGGRLISVPPRELGASPRRAAPFLRESMALVEAAVEHLGLDRERVARCLPTVRWDAGAHWTRSYRGSGGGEALTVNAFAANDPQSTEMILDWTLARLADTDGSRSLVGLLSLRADRADRSAQWLEAMERGFFHRFDRLYLLGFHASAFRRGLARRGMDEGVGILSGSDPEALMSRILAETGTRAVAQGGPGTNVETGTRARAGAEAGSRTRTEAESRTKAEAGAQPGSSDPVVFGFGNFGGMGERLVSHWMEGSVHHGP